jgi:Lar family restriction alleviation protein
MNEELKPCPFCGGVDIRIESEDIGMNEPVIDYEIFCMNCNSVAAHGCCRTEEAAIKAWNRRSGKKDT